MFALALILLVPDQAVSIEKVKRSATKIHYKARVGESLVKITVKGAQFRARRQSLFQNANYNSRSIMRTATEGATGCKVVDDFMNIAGELEGRLACLNADPRR